MGDLKLILIGNTRRKTRPLPSGKTCIIVKARCWILLEINTFFLSSETLQGCSLEHLVLQRMPLVLYSIDSVESHSKTVNTNAEEGEQKD